VIASGDAAGPGSRSIEDRGTIHRPERGGEGCSARKIVPRRALADWDPAGRGHDALATILAQNETRAQDLAPIRHGRMAASPWTYFRGAAAVMATDLASTPNTGSTSNCAVTRTCSTSGCGAHRNGPLFRPQGLRRDRSGPVRMGRQAPRRLARGPGTGQWLSEAGAQQSVSAALRGYAGKLREYATMPEIDIWYDRVDVDKLNGHLAPYDADELGSWIERKARKRTSRGASTKLTQVVDGRRTIIEDPPFRTHLQAVGDTDPEAIMAAYRGSESDPIADMVRQLWASADDTSNAGFSPASARSPAWTATRTTCWWTARTPHRPRS
jgi:hypothetical protein